MPSQAVRITTPRALLVPTVQGLFTRAFAGSVVVPQGFGGAVEDFVQMTMDPLTGVFLGVEDSKPVGLGIVTLPHSALAPYPQIVHLYNEGKPATARALRQAGVGFIKAAGYTKFWALNASRKPDEVWSRAFRDSGKAHPVATLMEFEV